MTAIVLVPGAWLGGWAWERVAPLLRSRGHSVHPITLPGLAERAPELTPSVGLMTHVGDVVRFCESNDLRDAMLVGHSYAGAVVGGAARRIPTRLRAQVYVDTMPLAEGESLVGQFSPAGRAKFDAAVAVERGVRVWPMPDPLDSQAPVDGLSPEDLVLLRQKGTPHPAFSFEERLSGPISSGPYPPFHAISCVEDDPAGAAERDEFLRSHPGWTYRHLTTGHWPMLSTASALARVLDEIASS